MLVTAKLVGQENGHAVDHLLCIGGAAGEFDNSVDALPEFGIGQANDDAGAHLGMCHHCGFDLRRIDIGATAENHICEPIAKIEIAFGVKPTDITERFPAIRTALGRGAEVVIGASSAFARQEIDFAAFQGQHPYHLHR